MKDVMPTAEKHQGVKDKHSYIHQFVLFVPKREGISCDCAAAQKLHVGFSRLHLIDLNKVSGVFIEAFKFNVLHLLENVMQAAFVKVYCQSGLEQCTEYPLCSYLSRISVQYKRLFTFKHVCLHTHRRQLCPFSVWQ